MGLRIHFYKNNCDKTVKDLVIENYLNFSQWYVKRNNASMKEFGEMYGTKELIDFFSKNDNLVGIDLIEKKILDELVAEFVSEFTDTHGYLDFFGPTMGKWRYQGSTDLILKTKNQEFIKLWSFLINGRSLNESQEFNSYTNEYKIGYLSFKEHTILKQMIFEYFGVLQDMKEKYWTNSEKQELDKAIQNGNYTLSGHNPITSGIEFVLEALTDIETELITGIEF